MHVIDPRINKWQVPRTVQVLEMGPNADNAEFIWIVFHGYAQNTDALAKVFYTIAENDMVIIPEAMSRFYRKGYEGEVVASWMTSRYREDEIEDQQAYLDSLYDRLPDQHSSKIIILAFSQGAATALRWLEKSKPGISSLAIYAGWPPDDVDYQGKYWVGMDHFYLLGDNDYFINDEREKELREKPYFRHCKPEEISFIGPHEVLAEVLEDLRNRL